MIIYYQIHSQTYRAYQHHYKSVFFEPEFPETTAEPEFKERPAVSYTLLLTQYTYAYQNDALWDNLEQVHF